MFAYSLVSDLHVNHPQPSVVGLERFVIVAGDTSNGLDGLKMLNKWKRRGHTVFAVDGNHEHYSNSSQGRTIDQTEAQFYSGLDQPETMQVDDTLWVIGCNGWYPVADEEAWLGYMNDGRYAGRAAAVNAKAADHPRLLVEQLGLLPAGHKAIVVTHTAPCEESLDPRYVGSEGNQWYWNPELTRVMEAHADKIAIWHHGHTHASVDVTHSSGVRIVTNPRGYPRENPKWAPRTFSI